MRASIFGFDVLEAFSCVSLLLIPCYRVSGSKVPQDCWLCNRCIIFFIKDDGPINRYFLVYKKSHDDIDRCQPKISSLKEVVIAHCTVCTVTTDWKRTACTVL